MTASSTVATSVRPPLSSIFIAPAGANGVLAEELYQGDFIDRGENVIIFSGVGRGKAFFANAIGRASGKKTYRMMSDVADLTYLDIKQPIRFCDVVRSGDLGNAPQAVQGLRPELVDCELLILDGLPDPDKLPSFSEQLSKLLKVRADAGRSTIVLVTGPEDRELLGRRFPVTLEGRKWHVLDFGS